MRRFAAAFAPDQLIGVEGRGFQYLLDGLNAERALIAAECIGDGYWFVDRASKYANERVVFDRPIGRNQGIQFPIAEAFIEVEAANFMRFKACRLFDAKRPCGAEANMAKYPAAKASWEAANVCLQAYGGFGFATESTSSANFGKPACIKWQVAPISTNLIFSYIAERVLGLPRSYLRALHPHPAQLVEIEPIGQILLTHKRARGQKCTAAFGIVGPYEGTSARA